MKVSDFRWLSHAPNHAQPDKPVIILWQVQTAPPAGAFAVMVEAAITESVGPAIRHHFVCTVEVEADENKPGWKDAMKALLVRACVAKWDS